MLQANGLQAMHKLWTRVTCFEQALYSAQTMHTLNTVLESRSLWWCSYHAKEGLRFGGPLERCGHLACEKIRPADILAGVDSQGHPSGSRKL